MLRYLAKVEVTWTNPDKYTDIKNPFYCSQSTKKDALYNIESHLKRMAKKLPDGYLLKLDVTNLDLADETFSTNLRVVKQTLKALLRGKNTPAIIVTK